MKEEFEATIIKDSYVGRVGWVEDYIVEINSSTTFEDMVKPFEGKKVKITIEEIE